MGMNGGRVSAHATFQGGLFGQEKKWHGIDGKIGPFLKKGSFVAVVLWVAGIAAVYSLAPADSYEYLDGAERTANIILLAILAYTNISRFLHILIRDRGLAFVNTGVLFGAAVVQVLTVLSVCLMVLVPTPVLLDEVTGMRCHLIRWVEWSVLAFLMTFLTESMDMPLEENPDTTTAWMHGIALGLSTCSGWIFPLCPNPTYWMMAFTNSWTLFCSLFVRLYQRYQRLLKLPSEGSVDVREEYNRAKYSLKTILVCTCVWTLLAASFSTVAFLRPRMPADSIWSADSLILVVETIYETISKVWYFNLLLEVHNVVFDDAARMMRRLEELRRFMSTVWNTSSDIMIWTSDEADRVHAVISPAFFDFCGTEASSGRSSTAKRPTLVLEIDRKKGSYTYRVFHMDMSSSITRQDAMDIMFQTTDEANEQDLGNEVAERNLAVVAELLADIYTKDENEIVLTKELASAGKDGKREKISQCEAKISRLESSCLVTLRDISERFERFEIEKRLVEEKTARKKDAEANRFTRHEVKNSILAAIGVLESIRSSSQPRTPLPSINFDRSVSDGSISASGNGTEASVTGSIDNEYSTFDDHAGELDNTLRTVLDTIMDHAMSREVINEEYELRKERVLVPEVISNIRRQTNTASPRFSLQAHPSDFPILGMDPRLLRYIYQNALSNACRYGKRGGAVDTSVFYDETKKEFRMEVVNLPGVGHEELVALSHEEIQDRVFSPGSRLHKKTLEESEMGVTNSSGDGAWIMGKCVRIMKGECDLRFEPDRTVFSFACPAKRHMLKERVEREFTALPENTWGVVIDDSGIQRKLMDRYLKIAGVEKDRRIIVGKDSNEIYGFSDMVIDLVRKNPDDKFLVIADENLDVIEGAALHSTVSGSLSLQKILQKLSPPDESRVIALVRSANDSAKEAELYKSRAHGYLIKAPIDKNGVLGSIRPWWFKRFPRDGGEGDGSSPSSSVSSLDTEDYDPYGDIKANLEVLDALCLATGTSLRNRWRSIKERLQVLKGDIKSTISRDGLDIKILVEAIDNLRHGRTPEDLQERWKELRAQIVRALDTPR